MPRLARPVFAGVPHHITQRGNRREDVFFSDEDRQAYLEWLSEYAKQHHVEIIAYCLMTNHVHVVAVPAEVDGLEKMFRPLHTRYAQRINRSRGWKGHLWQGRFFSSALDEPYTWAAIRYVEQNPVRAAMVTKAEDYAWSSAPAHCGFRQDPVLTTRRRWQEALTAVDDWSAWLSLPSSQEHIGTLRSQVERGLPCGAPSFIRKLERRAGQSLAVRPRGRPRKQGTE